MAIDKSYIQTEVARRIERSVADVTDAEIASAIQLISMRVPALVAECTTATVIGQEAYELASLPKKFKRVEAVRLDEPDNKDALGEIKSFEQYQSMLANATENDEPSSFIIWGEYLYLFPRPDAVYTLRLFAQVFERDASSIELPDSFLEPIVSYTAYNVLKNKGQGAGEEARAHFADGDMWVSEMNKIESEKIRVDYVQYTDL